MTAFDFPADRTFELGDIRTFCIFHLGSCPKAIRRQCYLFYRAGRDGHGQNSKGTGQFIV